MKELSKVGVLSDLHLGEEDEGGTILNTRTRPGRKRIQELCAMLKAEREDQPFDQLVLLGDILDFSLENVRDVYSAAKTVLEQLVPAAGCNDLLYVPGNHDHHIWAQIIEQELVVDPLESCNPSGVAADYTGAVDEKLPARFLDGLLPRSDEMKLQFMVKYPHHLVRAGGRLYFMTHGHFLDMAFRPVNLFLEPRDLSELEQFNSGWLEAIWYHLGQAGRWGNFAESFYKRLSSLVSGPGRLPSACRLAYLLIGIALRRLWRDDIRLPFPAPREPRAAALRGKPVSSALKREISRYLQRYVLDWYDSKLGTGFRYRRPLPRPFTFVFGHTHRYAGPGKHEVSVRGQSYPILNTGGWIKDAKNAVLLVLNQQGAHIRELE